MWFSDQYFFPLFVIDWQVEYHYDRMESFNGTDTYYKFRFDIVKKDEAKNVFTIDGTVELLQDLNDDWKV